MLNDLRRPASEVFRACLHFQGLILHLDSLIAFALSGAAEKRQTAFLGIVCAVLLDDLGIKHHRVGRGSSALVKKGNDAFAHADHIRCHANTAFSVCHQCTVIILIGIEILYITLAPLC